MDRFHILAVCTGNVARSPMAQALLASGLGGLPGVVVTSAGTQALVGSPMAPEARYVLAEMGYPVPDHRARPLTPPAVHEADLVVTMTQAHRHEVEELDASLAPATFALRGLSILAPLVSNDHLLLTARARASRGHVDPVRFALTTAVMATGLVGGTVLARAARDDLAVTDPVGRGIAAYRDTAEAVWPAAASIVAYLLRAVAVLAR